MFLENRKLQIKLAGPVKQTTLAGDNCQRQACGEKHASAPSIRKQLAVSKFNLFFFG